MKPESYRAVWPEVLGLRPVLIVVVRERDPQGKFKDTYLFTTEMTRGVSWVVESFARRWSIENVFHTVAEALVCEVESVGLKNSTLEEVTVSHLIY